MTRRDRRRIRNIRLATLVALSAGLFAVVAGPSSADVTSVTGSAFGARGSVSLFGGPPQVFGPVATVTLPASGGDETDSAPSATFQAGPAVLLESGALNVSTQGTTGPSGSVTSTASVTGVADGPGPFLYQGVESTCTASESGVSGSTTIAGGVVETRYDPDTEEPVATEPVPGTPTPNLEITGTLDHVGDSFRIVFNEQITNPDGSLTVNGAHLFLLGPTAVGDVIIAQSVCGVAATATTTTAGPGGTTTTVGPGGTTTTVGPGGTTTTVAPGGTTTTRPGATTTTVRGATTTTVRGATTTTSAVPISGKDGAPPPSDGKSLVRTGAAFESLAVFAVLTLVLGALVLVGFGTRTVGAGGGTWSGPWAAAVRQAVQRHRRRRPWNRRPWL